MASSEVNPDQQVEAARFMAQLLGDTRFLEALDDGRSFTWAPKEDITPWELAICMYLVPLTLTGNLVSSHFRIYDAMPSEAQRHFRVGNLTGEEVQS